MQHLRVQKLEQQIAEHEERLQQLKLELDQLKASASAIDISDELPALKSDVSAPSKWDWPLAADEYKRYGRQLILPEVGLQGQLKLKGASVLIVGLGGLGCPAAAYLAGAGTGVLGLMDGDTVELSNLHRQILHASRRVGMLKVESVRESVRALNPLVTCNLHPDHLSAATALDTFASYDLILDCTDNPATRYLISDAAVLAGKPLISASALRTDGQLLVLNHPPTPLPLDDRIDATGASIGGPCYRCVFPKPPPADAVLSCGEGGILGPVVGVMGVLMALEAIKLLISPTSQLNSAATSTSASQHASPTGQGSREHSMLIFSAVSSPPFRSIRLKGKRSGCSACSDEASITAEALRSRTLDHVAFCGVRNPVCILSPDDRVSARDFEALIRMEPHVAVHDRSKMKERDYVLLDVRDEAQYGLCALDGSLNVPWPRLQAIMKQSAPVDGSEDVKDGLPVENDPLTALQKAIGEKNDIYTLCRFGNDSQLAVQKLRELGFALDGSRSIRDVAGGLKAWKEDVDQDWPEY